MRINFFLAGHVGKGKQAGLSGRARLREIEAGGCLATGVRGSCEKRKKSSMGTRLYVGNLSFNTMEDDVRALFAKCGTVANCDLIADKFTGKSRGFAFVEMGAQEEADKAVAELNGKEFDGRVLTVNEAKPREERPRRDFGDDRGRDRGDRYR